jgi:hypothetical protein
LAPHAAVATVAPEAAIQPGPRETIEVPDSLAPDRVAFAGRCVDATGRPFPDCRVEVRPLRAPAAAVSRSSAADGTFRVALHHQGTQYQVLAAHPGCMAVTRTCLQQSPGATVETGDIALLPGCLLHGHVIDEAHAGIAGVDVAAQRWSLAVAAFEPVSLLHTTTDASGRFELLVASGCLHNFRVSGCDAVEPSSLRVGPDQRDAQLELSVVRQPYVARITGHVRDSNGEPVCGAQLEASSMEPGKLLLSAVSAGDGSFTFGLRTAGAIDVPVRLEAHHDRCETGRAGPLAWNTAGVEIVLETAPRHVLSLRCQDRRPAQAVVVLCTMGGYQTGPRPCLRGPFPGGLVLLPPLTPGKYGILVVPDPATGVAWGTVTLELGHATEDPVLVELPPLLQRGLSVRYRSGEPAAGAHFELFSSGTPVSEATQAVGAVRWSSYMAERLLVQEGNCDESGHAVLLGAPEPLPLRVSHSGCLVSIEQDVRFDVDEDHVVELQRGGTLRGKVVPPAAVQGLRTYAGVATGTVPSPQDGPVVQLLAEGGARRWPQTGSPVAADGSFDLRGAAAGRWRIMLQCRPRVGNGGLIDEQLGSVEFRGDETEERVLDATELVPATLTGRITLDGNGRAGILVQLSVERPNGRTLAFSTETRVDGAYELPALAGKWGIAAAIRSGPASGWTQYRWPEPLQLASGEARICDFAFARGALRLRCLAPDGSPVGRLQLQVRTAQGSIRTVTPATDADGRTRAELDVGSYRLFALPRSLQEPPALQAWLTARPGKVLADALLLVGIVDIGAGAADEQELRLPAEWDR